MPRLFGSIEDRQGVNEPGYRPPPPEPVRIAPETDSHRLGELEAFVALVMPLAGFGLAVWRFGRGDVGPGVANLILGCLGVAVGLGLVIAGGA